jgi:glycerophosphoryl diester phosphodiesterase
MEELYVAGALAAAALLFCAALCLACCHHRKKHPLMPLLQKTSYAHRGLHGEGLPENSLSAIKKAAERGYGIEFDLHLTADGKLAVVHDDSLLRVCGADVRVCESSLAELRCHPLKNGEPIPCFEEVLSAVEGRVPLLIELKSDGNNGKALVRACLAVLEDYKGPYCIESFAPRVLFELKKQAPGVARGQLSYNYLKKSSKSYPVRLLLYTMLSNGWTKPDFVAYKQADQGSVPCRLAKLAGIPLFFWTVRDRTTALEEIGKGNAVIFEKFEL